VCASRPPSLRESQSGASGHRAAPRSAPKSRSSHAPRLRASCLVPCAGESWPARPAATAAATGGAICLTGETVVANDLVRRGVPFQHLAGLLVHDHRARLVYESVRQCFVPFCCSHPRNGKSGRSRDGKRRRRLARPHLPNLGIGADAANHGRFVDGSAHWGVWKCRGLQLASGKARNRPISVATKLPRAAWDRLRTASCRPQGNIGTTPKSV